MQRFSPFGRIRHLVGNSVGRGVGQVPCARKGGRSGGSSSRGIDAIVILAIPPWMLTFVCRSRRRRPRRARGLPGDGRRCPRHARERPPQGVHGCTERRDVDARPRREGARRSHRARELRSAVLVLPRRGGRVLRTAGAWAPSGSAGSPGRRTSGWRSRRSAPRGSSRLNARYQSTRDGAGSTRRGERGGHSLTRNVRETTGPPGCEAIRARAVTHPRVPPDSGTARGRSSAVGAHGARPGPRVRGAALQRALHATAVQRLRHVAAVDHQQLEDSRPPRRRRARSPCAPAAARPGPGRERPRRRRSAYERRRPPPLRPRREEHERVVVPGLGAQEAATRRSATDSPPAASTKARGRTVSHAPRPRHRRGDDLRPPAQVEREAGASDVDHDRAQARVRDTDRRARRSPRARRAPGSR